VPTKSTPYATMPRSATRTMIAASVVIGALTCPALAVAAPTAIVPGAPAASSFATSANGEVVAYDTDEGPGDLTAKSKVFLWNRGHLSQISAGLRTEGGTVAVTPDGSVVGFEVLRHGDEETAFYSVATHRLTFLRGYVLPSPSYLTDADSNDVMTNSGSVLAVRFNATSIDQEQHPVGGVYNRNTGKFTRLPHPHGDEAEPLSISGNGEVVIYDERKAYVGEIARVVYNLKTRKQARLREGNDRNLHLLSENGETAVTLYDDVGLEDEYFPLYDYATSTVSAIKLGNPDSVSMNGPGTVFGMTCGANLYTYNTVTKEYSLLGNLPGDVENALPQVATRGVLTEDGNEMIFNAYYYVLNGPSEESHAPAGIYEVPTVGATPAGATLPTPCTVSNVDSLNPS
jgi:hypothetical protein